MDDVIQTRERWLAHVRERIAPLQPTHLIVFGSAATAAADRVGDLDLLVVSTRVERVAYGNRRKLVAFDLPVHVDARFFTPTEFEAIVLGSPEGRRCIADGIELVR